MRSKKIVCYLEIILRPILCFVLSRATEIAPEFFPSHSPRRNVSFLLLPLEFINSLDKSFFYLLVRPVRQNVFQSFKIFLHFEKKIIFPFGWWRQSCICPLIDHRQKPIKIREYLGLLYKTGIDDCYLHPLERKIRVSFLNNSNND